MEEVPPLDLEGDMRGLFHGVPTVMLLVEFGICVPGMGGGT